MKTTQPELLEELHQKILNIPGVYIHEDGRVVGEIKEGWFSRTEEVRELLANATTAATEGAEDKTIFHIYNKFYQIIDDQPEMYQWFRNKMAFKPALSPERPE